MNVEVGWRELGLGMILAGTILLVLAVVVDAPVISVMTTAAILLGGILALGYGLSRGGPSENDPPR